MIRILKWVRDKFLLFLDFNCAFLELHLVKIVSIAIMAVCCFQVNALNWVIVSFLLLSLIFGSSSLKYSFTIIGPFVGLLFISKMIYQTKFIPDLTTSKRCKETNFNLHYLITKTILDPEWWGFSLLQPGESIISKYKGYVLLLLFLTLYNVIKIRQKIVRLDAGENPETPSVLYQKTTRREADKSLKDCIKFIINYGFYKFGVEITLSVCVFTIAFRQDFFSIIYTFWIMMLFMLERHTLSVLWSFFMACLVICIIYQYSSAVGLSEKTCFEYPWAGQEKLTSLFFLPSFEHLPEMSKTLVDFILLVLIQRQQAVFEIEKKYGEKYLGGSNGEIYMKYYAPNFTNPVPNHTGRIKSWIDLSKFIFMSCLFRITLAFVFLNGATNANLLSLGYLVGAFVFLWIDYDLCLWPIKKILLWWNILLGYTVLVIFMKIALQTIEVIFLEFFREHVFWLVKLIFVHCVIKVDHSSFCYNNMINIYWDVVCFILIIFQRRYFKSYYFLHEIDDVLGVYSLQDKGAKLMDELQENKLKKFHLRERRTLMKIKKEMNRIKDWQKRMQGFHYNEPTDHATAIYMGDYLMFTDVDYESRIDETSSSSDESEEDDDSTQKKPKKEKIDQPPTMSEFLGNVLKRTGDELTTKTSRKTNESDDRKYSKKDTDSRRLSKDDSAKFSKRSQGNARDPSESERLDEKDTLRLCKSFLDSVTVSLIKFFNKHSKDYRFIDATMKAERQKLKIKLRKVSEKEKKDEVTERYMKLNSPSLTKFGSKSQDLSSYDSEDDYFDDKKPAHALLLNLINSFYMFAISKTELFCYIMIFLHTVLSPTLISLPLPLLVFFWGSLTTIRPTTTFWTVLIAYTEVTVVIKAFFQNSIFPWNVGEEADSVRTEYPPLYLGIYIDNQFVIADLFLLLLLFLHRYKLKSLGLWNRTHEEETMLPQNLKVYKELPSESDYKDIKGNRSLLYHRKRLKNALTDQHDSISHFLKMATWRCTSRATAKLTFWGNKFNKNILVKEMEGPILVTHDGRRLQPTNAYVSQTLEEASEGNIVLRVYINDFIPDVRGLFYQLSWVQHFTSLRKFFVQILVRDWRVSADFYTLMFIFEFLNFLIVFFGYSSFTKSVEFQEENFSLADNQIPVLYLFAMISHFLVIMIDRILYLRKNVVGKLAFQFTLVILVHVWMFIVIPIVTESPFNRLYVPQTYYMISCLYFLMSAYQLRVGYPMRNQGHFLCKKYGYVNYYAYKGLKLIPFFNQLRTLTDFICTQSSLTMTEWIKLESIFQLVYENKCSRRADENYPVPRGVPCPKSSKLFPGIFVLCSLILIIWLPFIVFALFNTVAEQNLPQEATLGLQIGTYPKIYEAKATFTEIIPFTDSQFTNLQSVFKDNKKVWSILSLHDNRDVAVLKFRFDSVSPWILSPVQNKSLEMALKDLDVPISLYLVWEIQRIPRSQIVAHSRGVLEFPLAKNSTHRHKLMTIFDSNSTKMRLDFILPKFIQITNEGKAKPLSGFFSGHNRLSAYKNATLEMVREAGTTWWNFTELPEDYEDLKLFKIPHHTSDRIIIYTLNEKNIPKLLISISLRGIIGLYLSIVFVMWTIAKRFMWKYPYIMFEDMPNPDPVLKLCHDIYLARESHEFALEEDLYAKLIFLFRSPETMIKVTRLINTGNYLPRI